MLKRLIFSFLLVNLYVFSYSQSLQERIDSLHANYSTLENDSLRIRSLNFLSFYYVRLDTTFSKDSAVATIKRSYDLATKEGNYSYSNYPYIQYSDLATRSSDYDVALEVLLKYLDISRDLVI